MIFIICFLQIHKLPHSHWTFEWAAFRKSTYSGWRASGLLTLLMCFLSWSYSRFTNSFRLNFTASCSLLDLLFFASVATFWKFFKFRSTWFVSSLWTLELPLKSWLLYAWSIRGLTESRFLIAFNLFFRAV